MEYNESNFFYLKKTSMNKYYDELVKAECVCEYFPMAAKIIVRKVMEVFLKGIAEKESIEADVPVWTLLNNIKLNTNILVPEEIYNYIEIILVNGYEHPSQNRNKKISKHPIEILEIIHNTLCWYLKRTEAETMMSIGNLSFRAPSTIEYMEKQISKINNDVVFKDNQINNLRQKIIEFADKGKNISEINNIIITIKEDKSYLDNMQILLNRKIELQKKQVLEMEKNYKNYIKKCDDLKERCNESQELLFGKESQLVKAEIQNQELRNLIKELDDEDESIKKMELYIEQKLKLVRQAHENLLKLTKEYQDILETVEFSYDKELQKILGSKKNNIKVKMNFEDEVFNENIVEYTRNIADAKRKVIIFKEIVNEKIKRTIKYELFYRCFLGLKGRELRILYTIINITANLLINTRELFLKSNKDKILESINRNLSEVKNVNDDEIKLILYYKLMKLSQEPLGKINSKKQFIQNLDQLVDKAYEILINKKDFKNKMGKLEAVVAYYLEKLILMIKSQRNNKAVNEYLISKIYNKIFELKQRAGSIEQGKIYYEKFNLDIMSKAEFMAGIKSQPCTFLSIMVDLADINCYKEISVIIFEAYNILTQKLNEYEKEDLTTKFSIENFMMLLFMSNEATFSIQKQQEELLPFLITEIIAANFLCDSEEVNLESYNNMVYLWNIKQKKYNDNFIKKEEQEAALMSLLKERNELEMNYEKLLRERNTLSQKHSSYEDEFKRIIMNSEKRILLPSYLKYDELRVQKEKNEDNISRNKEKIGTLKRMVSPSVWKEQANKLINESNMEEAEKALIEEAKQKLYFKKEYSVFADLEKKIQKTNEMIEENKKEAQDKEALIDSVKIKISELDRKLSTIKEVYTDMEEGYY